MTPSLQSVFEDGSLQKLMANMFKLGLTTQHVLQVAEDPALTWHLAREWIALTRKARVPVTEKAVMPPRTLYVPPSKEITFSFLDEGAAIADCYRYGGVVPMQNTIPSSVSFICETQKARRCTITICHWGMGARQQFERRAEGQEVASPRQIVSAALAFQKEHKKPLFPGMRVRSCIRFGGNILCVGQGENGLYFYYGYPDETASDQIAVAYVS